MVELLAENQRTRQTTPDSGFTFIELVIVIIILGIFVTVATRTIDTSIDASRQAEVEDELNRLAIATVGNDKLASGGMRTDFGYVGDVGALPPSLDYLATNPGGYATWKGPYIRDNFVENSADYKTDPWGATYVYGAGVTIQSTGSGSAITKQFANSTSAILSTPLRGILLDRDGAPPGTDASNVTVTVTYPDGAGGTTSSTVSPNSSGAFSFSGLPIGNHAVTAVYTTANDTALAYVSALPGVGGYSGTMRLGSGYWANPSGGGGNPGSEILRPIAVGASTGLSSQNCSGNWSCVSEAVSDDAGTYVTRPGFSYKTDTYATQNSSISAGTIDSVFVRIHCYGTNLFTTASTVLRSGGSDYFGSQLTLSSNWTTYSTRYLTNPATGVAWTWTEIDALEVGVSLTFWSTCTQVWAEVFYH